MAKATELSTELYCEHCQEEPPLAYRYDNALYCQTCNFNLGIEDDDPLMDEYDEMILEEYGTLRFLGNDEQALAFTKGVGITADIYDDLITLALKVSKALNKDRA